MKLVIVTKAAKKFGIEFYQGYIIDKETKEVLHSAEAMSEEYLLQNLTFKMNRIENDAKAKSEKAAPKRRNPKLSNPGSSGDGLNGDKH